LNFFSKMYIESKGVLIGQTFWNGKLKNSCFCHHWLIEWMIEWMIELMNDWLMQWIFVNTRPIKHLNIKWLLICDRYGKHDFCSSLFIETLHIISLDKTCNW
jgi:hypothetical protein